MLLHALCERGGAGVAAVGGSGTFLVNFFARGSGSGVNAPACGDTSLLSACARDCNAALTVSGNAGVHFSGDWLRGSSAVVTNLSRDSDTHVANLGVSGTRDCGAGVSPGGGTVHP